MATAIKRKSSFYPFFFLYDMLYCTKWYIQDGILLLRHHLLLNNRVLARNRDGIHIVARIIAH